MAKAPLVDVASEKEGYKRIEDDIKEALRGALNFLDKESYVEVGLLAPESIRKLNKSFKDKDEPTNVLSFREPDVFPSDRERESIGEIYLAPEVIEDRDEDIIHLAVHGLLHLVGYTHEEKSDTIKMERKEEEIMSFLNEDN